MTELELMRGFSERLREALDERGMSQDVLAEAAHVDKATMSRYVNGKSMPTVKHLINITQVLGCNVKELIECTYFVR